MKKIFVLFLFISLACFSFAQGNLQFNAVKYYELSVIQSSTTVYILATQNVTVPAGKVWKVESSGACTYTVASNTTSNGGYMLLDGRIIGSSNGTYANNYAPIWLSAGTYTFALQGNSLGGGLTFNGFFSAIEFNIVP